eukprot:CAMPEP_0195528936 /NCGR_PEP_ID=MMETSP0794_2-20130614/31290_1 /TAXON_ID=515487 /ORGANISM="Stephanopyxis turris, Strain CCMP 815" /LENGTH=499 /DNA_ID=CAMNT_0040660151 /DNA_START=76 /DNA_END=1575 /DNA_ORIENTATION=+
MDEAEPPKEKTISALERLNAARNRRHVSLQQVHQQMGIRDPDADDSDEFEDDIRIRNFLKSFRKGDETEEQKASPSTSQRRKERLSLQIGSCRKQTCNLAARRSLRGSVGGAGFDRQSHVNAKVKRDSIMSSLRELALVGSSDEEESCSADWIPDKKALVGGESTAEMRSKNNGVDNAIDVISKTTSEGITEEDDEARKISGEIVSAPNSGLPDRHSNLIAERARRRATISIGQKVKARTAASYFLTEGFPNYDEEDSDGNKVDTKTAVKRFLKKRRESLAKMEIRRSSIKSVSTLGGSDNESDDEDDNHRIMSFVRRTGGNDEANATVSSALNMRMSLQPRNQRLARNASATRVSFTSGSFCESIEEQSLSTAERIAMAQKKRRKSLEQLKRNSLNSKLSFSENSYCNLESDDSDDINCVKKLESGEEGDRNMSISSRLSSRSASRAKRESLLQSLRNLVTDMDNSDFLLSDDDDLKVQKSETEMSGEIISVEQPCQD